MCMHKKIIHILILAKANIKNWFDQKDDLPVYSYLSYGAICIFWLLREVAALQQDPAETENPSLFVEMSDTTLEWGLNQFY